MRPWDVSNDLLQYESDYKVQTWTRHRTPVVRTCSITSLEKQPENLNSSIRNTSIRRLKVVGEESESSCPEVDARHDSDSSERPSNKSNLKNTQKKKQTFMMKKYIYKNVYNECKISFLFMSKFKLALMN